MNRREFLGLGLAFAVAPRLPTGSPLVLVTADTEAHVVALSLAGNVRKRLATLQGPRSIERAPGAQAVVAHTSHGAISLLEGVPPRVRRVLRGFGQPRYTAVRRDGRYAYVSDSGHGEVAVVDLARGRVIRRVEVGALARHISLAPDQRTLWVSLGSSAAAIAVVDVSAPAHPRMRRLIRPPFLAHDVGFAPDGEHVWVTAGRDHRMAIYRPGARAPERILHADDAPQHVTFRGALAYVASGDSGTVQLRDVASGALRRTTGVPLGSYNVQATAGRVLTPSLDRGTITVLDAAGRVLIQRTVAPAAHDACVIG